MAKIMSFNGIVGEQVFRNIAACCFFSHIFDKQNTLNPKCPIIHTGFVLWLMSWWFVRSVWFLSGSLQCPLWAHRSAAVLPLPDPPGREERGAGQGRAQNPRPAGTLPVCQPRWHPQLLEREVQTDTHCQRECVCVCTPLCVYKCIFVCSHLKHQSTSLQRLDWGERNSVHCMVGWKNLNWVNAALP